MEYNCALVKVDGLAACIEPRVVGAILVVSSGVSVKFAQSPANEKQGLIP
jgi:hypothetical protein